MSPRLPDGEPAPGDGALPRSALAGLGSQPFGVYVHVPFCASRCGYCDFNTYVPGEGVGRAGFVDAVLAEWALAERVLGGAPPPPTVFVGGGPPTLLPDAERRAGRPGGPRADAHAGRRGRGGTARARRRLRPRLARPHPRHAGRARS